MLDDLMKKVLSGTYGGPSISFEEGKFVLYRWYDAPVGDEILVEAETWDEFVEKLEKYKPE